MDFSIEPDEKKKYRRIILKEMYKLNQRRFGEQLIVDHDRELTGKVNLMTWSGSIFSTDVNKKGHTTSSCILSEVTILRNKRSENVFLRDESTCFNLSRNLFF